MLRSIQAVLSDQLTLVRLSPGIPRGRRRRLMAPRLSCLELACLPENSVTVKRYGGRRRGLVIHATERRTQRYQVSCLQAPHVKFCRSPATQVAAKIEAQYPVHRTARWPLLRASVPASACMFTDDWPACWKRRGCFALDGLSHPFRRGQTRQQPTLP